MSKSEDSWEKALKTVADGRLSVIMPVHNLAGSIFENLRRTAELFMRHSLRVELVPVDDGSTDGTADEIARFCAETGKGEPDGVVTVNPVSLKSNSGKGAALRAGFEASSGAYVMLLDGDLDINPKQTGRFFEEMSRTSSDIVVGSKRHPESVVQYPWHRRIVSWVYFTLVKYLVGVPITDTQTGMKLFKRKVLEDALPRMLVKTYAFDLELLSIAVSRGAKIAEAPVVIRFGDKFGALSLDTVKAMAKDSLAVFYRLKLLKYYDKVMPVASDGVKPLVSIVIACPNRSWMLDECLKAIGAQTYRNFETIVLPDAEEEMETDVAAAARLAVIPTGKVRPAEKRNLGIARAKGEIVAFIDDDAYPDAKWLEYAVRYFTEPSVGAVGGPGVTPPNDGFLERMSGRVYDCRMVSGGYKYRYRAGGVRRDVDDYPSCNLFVRRDVLEKIGGYRTDFWPGEDTLLCKDIVDKGFRIVYDPWVVVYHHRRRLFGPHLRQLGRYAFHRGYFVKRFPSNSARLSYFIPSALTVYLALLGFASAVAVSMSFDAAVPLWYARSLAVASVPAALYLALALVSSFSFNPAVWLLTLLGIISTHVVYGLRFIGGLSAAKAPCQYIGKDHA
jgi:glycosyltransferase involved in cell wall biosynthesis